MIRSHLALSIIGGVILFLSFAFAKTNGGFLSWFLLYFLIALIVYEALTSWFALWSLQLIRRVSTHQLSASETLDVEFLLTRRSIWPLFFAKVSDELPERLSAGVDSPVQTIMPLWKRQIVCGYQMEKMKRGIYHLRNVRVESGDLLGLQRVVKDFPCHDEIVVYPHVVPIRGWNGVHAEDLGQRQPFKRRHEESSNVIGIRGYVPGDRLSRIHWPASAKTGILQAKEFEQHVSNEWMFIPDTSKHSFVASDNGRLFDLEMTITASLMKFAHDKRKKFSAGIYTERLQYISAARNEGPFMRCMKTLAELEPVSQIPFARGLQKVAAEFQSGHTFVVISPSLCMDMAAAIVGLKKRNSIEWFIPLLRASLNEKELHMVRILQANHIRIHLISSPDQLTMLEQGGV